MAIVMITTLSLSPFPTALPEHKQFHRNFQPGTQFAHYRVVLFRCVHSLKTTGSNDFESPWLQGSICEQALYFSSMGLAVNCAGLRYVVIGAGVIRVAFLLLLTMRRDLVLFHSPRSKDADVKAKILLKLEFPVWGQDELKRSVNSQRKQNKINIAWRCTVQSVHALKHTFTLHIPPPWWHIFLWASNLFHHHQLFLSYSAVIRCLRTEKHL